MKATQLLLCFITFFLLNFNIKAQTPEGDGTDYEQMNAFYIKKLAECLSEKGYENVEYIPTTDKGYRANGERHPHSWAIVDKKILINCMLNK